MSLIDTEESFIWYHCPLLACETQQTFMFKMYILVIETVKNKSCFKNEIKDKLMHVYLVTLLS